MDLDRFLADEADRLRPAKDRVDHPKLPMDADAQATIDAAIIPQRRARTGQVSGVM